MKSDVTRYVLGCMIYCKHKSEHKKSARLLASHRVVGKPFKVVACDLIGPFVKSKRGCKYILIIIDSFSKFTLVIPLRNAICPLVCPAVEDHFFLMFGQPEIL